ncbi:MAG TPA: zinc-binding dehydrogenase [Elusimicrobiota bacterium]|nr:zinc-binding dehydrogenase [Elusimicrobiota bacterium]
MSVSYPARMRAVFLTNYESAALSVDSTDVPSLKPGDVLVKMAAASINPSDLVFLRNQYGIQKKLPVVPGFEGSGTVVAARAGFYGRWLLGKRVACRAPEDGHGTWAQYMVCPASNCVPLRRHVSLEAGASLLVNPLTAWSFLKLARRGGHRGIVQTAAASALGRMIDRLGRRHGFEIINIVRRREQASILSSQGARHILNCADPDFEEKLRELAERLRATLTLDAVGGGLTAVLARAMPKDGWIIVYGALAGENCQISPRDLIFGGRNLSGFWLTRRIARMNWPERLWMVYRVQSYLHADLRTDVQARYPLEKVTEAIDFYKQRRSDGKVLLTP